MVFAAFGSALSVCRSSSVIWSERRSGSSSSFASDSSRRASPSVAMNGSSSTPKNSSAFQRSGSCTARFPFSMRFMYAALTPSFRARSACWCPRSILSSRSRRPMFALTLAVPVGRSRDVGFATDASPNRFTNEFTC